MAEHGHQGPAIGVAFDGTGYGADGAIWGGEAMVADFCGFRRLSHLQYLPLAGGDAAIRHPARIAATFLLALFGEIPDLRLREILGEERSRILTRWSSVDINTVRTSSCGRLFDVAAALLSVRDEVSYEAQAAIELETLARRASPSNRTLSLLIERRCGANRRHARCDPRRNCTRYAESRYRSSVSRLDWRSGEANGGGCARENRYRYRGPERRMFSESPFVGGIGRTSGTRRIYRAGAPSRARQ